MDFTQLFMYFITVNKYRFCISVIGYINVQSIGIGYKKSISVDHYLIVIRAFKRHCLKYKCIEINLRLRLRFCLCT